MSKGLVNKPTSWLFSRHCFRVTIEHSTSSLMKWCLITMCNWYHAYIELKRWNKKQAFRIEKYLSKLFHQWKVSALFISSLGLFVLMTTIVGVSSQENKDQTLSTQTNTWKWLSLKVLTKIFTKYISKFNFFKVNQQILTIKVIMRILSSWID